MLCPICQKELLKSKMQDKHYIDFNCNAEDNHFYGKRISRINADIILKIKIRLSELLLKINFDENTSEIWYLDKQERITLNMIIEPDFSDLKKLESKIKTYLIFS